MINKKPPTYKKHNSFVDLRSSAGEGLQGALTKIHNLFNANDSFFERDSLGGNLLSRIKADLFGSGTSNFPKFSLTDNVLEEIKYLNSDQLKRYLIHRYRYEIYPQTKEIDDYPPYLQIEPTSVCNYRCVFCFETDKFFTKKSNGFMGQMTIDTFKKIIDQAVGNIEFISLASRGEPLLCKDIEEMLAYTRGKFLNLKLNTNASLLDEKKAHAILQSGVKTLVFSADAAEEELYAKLRVGGSLKKVLKNIELFERIRQNHYHQSTIITRVSGVKFSDEQDINSMESLWGGLVNQVAFVDYNPWENVYEKKSSGIDDPCSDLWRRMFVWWDGKINPCDVDYRSTLMVGSLDEINIRLAWNSSKYRELRKSHLDLKRGFTSPCSNCSVV